MWNIWELEAWRNNLKKRVLIFQDNTRQDLTVTSLFNCSGARLISKRFQPCMARFTNSTAVAKATFQTLGYALTEAAILESCRSTRNISTKCWKKSKWRLPNSSATAHSITTTALRETGLDISSGTTSFSKRSNLTAQDIYSPIIVKQQTITKTSLSQIKSKTTHCCGLKANVFTPNSSSSSLAKCNISI